MSGKNSEMEEIWALLAEEGQENLQTAEDSLLKLEKNLSNSDEIARLFRSLHTFKGTVRMMNFSITEAFAHHAEDLVALVRDEGIPLDQEIINLLLDAIDKMRVILDHILSQRVDVEPIEIEAFSAKLLAMVNIKKSTSSMPHLPEQSSSVTEMKAAPSRTKNAETGKPKKAKAERSISKKTTEEESHFEAVIFESSDLAGNPEYIKIFTDMAQGEINNLTLSLEKLKGGLPSVEPDVFSSFSMSVDSLQIAAEQMGYTQLTGILNEFLKLDLFKTGSYTSEIIPEMEELINKIKIFIGQVESPISITSAPSLETKQPDNLLLSWYSHHIKLDIEQLGQLTNQLNIIQQQSAVNDKRYLLELCRKISGNLSHIYNGCVFFHLERAAYLTLVVQNLLFHIGQGEITTNQAIITLLETYIDRLSNCLNSTSSVKKLEEQQFEVLIDLAQQINNQSTSNPLFQVVNSIIDSFNISPQLRDTLTIENLVEIGQALRADQSFFIITANLEEDENISVAFTQWLRSGSVSLITSMVDSNSNPVLSIFWITSPENITQLKTALKNIDPQNKFLAINSCDLELVTSPDNPPETISTSYFQQSAPTETQNNENLSAETMTELTEMIGELVAEQATLQRLLTRILNYDTVEMSVRLIRKMLENAQVKQDISENIQISLTNLWEKRDTDINTLVQTEMNMNAVLIELQEKTRSLGLKPARDLFLEINALGQSLALHSDKKININFQGEDIELDQHTYQIVGEVIEETLKYCLIESMEKTQIRQESGKPAIGEISTIISQIGNRVQITVKDDGLGIPLEKIKNQAIALGWGDQHTIIPQEKLISWVFNPEFYLIDPQANQPKIDLAALKIKILAQGGGIDLISQENTGIRFDINLPVNFSVLDGMIVRIGDIVYIIPVNGIERILQPAEADIMTASADQSGNLLKINNNVYPIKNIGSLNDCRQNLLIMLEKEPRSIALQVDELLGRQSVLVKPLPGLLRNARYASGCVLLGEGEVGLVLNIDML